VGLSLYTLFIFFFFSPCRLLAHFFSHLIHLPWPTGRKYPPGFALPGQNE
jgi:predicted metalloenzyme YecM